MGRAPHYRIQDTVVIDDAADGSEANPNTGPAGRMGRTLCYNCYNYRGGWREYCGLVDSERRVKTRPPGGNQPPLPPGCLAYTRTQWEPTAAIRLACRINISEADINEVCCDVVGAVATGAR